MLPPILRRVARVLPLLWLTMLAMLAGLTPRFARADSDARPAGPQFFLSWYKPWGEKGAALERRPACRDTTAADTLYLCFRPAQDQPRFCAFTGDLYFHAAAPETLGTYWHFEHGAENQSGLSVRYQPVEGETGIAQPWTSTGVGVVGWLRTPVTGHLRLAFAVDTVHSVPLVKDRTYTLARIALHAHVDGLTGCEQGVAIELGRATIALQPGEEYVVTRGGSRWLVSGERGIASLAAYRGVGMKAARKQLRRPEPPVAWSLEP